MGITKGSHVRPPTTKKSAPISWLTRGCLFIGLLLFASCSSEDPAPATGTSGGACVAPAQSCNGVCVDIQRDATNCGGCGSACLAGQTCQGGTCTVSCVAPQVDCGGLCADPSSNSLHCGGCNQACPSGQICQNSACVTGSCPAGQSQCNGACVDTQSDTVNCGVCNNGCLAGQSCQAGTCTGAAATVGGMGGATSTAATTGATMTGSTNGSGTTTMTTTTGSTTGTGGATSSTTTNTVTSTTGAGGTGGSVVGVGESDSCPDITWPSSNGSKNLGSGITVAGGEVYDGGMAVHEGSLEDCSTGDQDSVDPLIDVADGGTVRNVIFGKNVGDGIHCNGSCTIENVWFPYVCDDAISALGGGTVSIKNSGFKNARDKTIQHNGSGTINLDTVYVETAGKLYRSCGEGCSGSSRTANLSNIVAIGVDQIAGVSANDTVTLKNICVHRSFSLCSIYEPGSSDEVTSGVNGSNEGPNANCKFTAADTHALLSKVGGIPFTTDTVCGGPNAYKSGSTATACVAGFDSCLKACMPGGYGFKQVTCTDGKYAEGDGVICAMPTDPTAAQNLDPARVMGATSQVDNNDECSTEWAIGIQASNNSNYCVCVRKPGYYDHDNWLSWDCQRRWW